MKKRNEENSDLVCRDLTLRSVDESKRMATFCAATENGVNDYNGRQFLRIGGMDLSRYAKNPVVLDTHDRYSIDSIIGKAEMSKEGRELIAKVTFANTPKGDQAFGLVKAGMLNAGSVGFIPDKKTARDLGDGEMDGDGEYAIKGPGRVLNNSQLFEFSLCPVGADENALRRSFEKENVMTEQEKSEAEKKQKEQRAQVPVLQSTALELAARDIRALAGDNEALKVVAERCILEGKSFDDSRKEMLAEHTKRSAPVGTPDPDAADKKAAEEKKKAADAAAGKREVTDDVLLRSLTGSLSTY